MALHNHQRQAINYRAMHADEESDGDTVQPMPKCRGRAAVVQTVSRSRTSPSGTADRRPMHMMQQAGRVGRLIANDKLSYENKPSSSLNKKKSDRRYDRSVSHDEFFDDNEETEYPMYQLNSSNQLKVPSRTDDSERELSRRRMKLTARDVSKENYYLSDDEDVKMKSKHDTRRKLNDSRDVSPERCYSSKTHNHSNHRSLGRMKPEQFDGSTCFETFLVQFNNCAQFNRWDDMDKLIIYAGH